MFSKGRGSLNIDIHAIISPQDMISHDRIYILVGMCETGFLLLDPSNHTDLNSAILCRSKINPTKFSGTHLQISQTHSIFNRLLNANLIIISASQFELHDTRVRRSLWPF